MFNQNVLQLRLHIHSPDMNLIKLERSNGDIERLRFIVQILISFVRDLPIFVLHYYFTCGACILGLAMYELLVN